MPKKQHTISNFVAGINRSVAPREDSSAIRQMVDIDPVKEIGEISVFKSMGESNVPYLEEGLSISDSTCKSTPLATMSHDFAYATPPSGRYTSILEQSGQPEVSADPTMDVSYWASSSAYLYNNAPGLGGIKWGIQMYINGSWKYLHDPAVTNSDTAEGASVSGDTFHAGYAEFWTTIATQVSAYNTASQDGVTTDVDMTYSTDTSTISLSPASATTDDYTAYNGAPFAIRMIVFCNAFWLTHGPGSDNPYTPYEYQWITTNLYFDSVFNGHSWEVLLEQDNELEDLGGIEYLGTAYTESPFGFHNFGEPTITDNTQPAIRHKVKFEVVKPVVEADAYLYDTTINGTTTVVTTGADDSTSALLVDDIVTAMTSALGGTLVVADVGGNGPAYYTIEGLADGTHFTVDTEVRAPAGTSFTSSQTPTNYVAFANNNGQIFLYDDFNNIWTYDIDNVPNASSNSLDVTLMATKGVIRACDIRWGSSGAPRWIGHIERGYFGTATGSGLGSDDHQHTVNAWVEESVTIEKVAIQQIKINTSGITAPTATYPIFLSIGAVSGGQWTNANGEHKFGISTLYDDGAQESQINTTCNTDDNSIDLGGTDRRLTFTFGLHEQDFASSPTHLRVSGFRIYAQEPDSDRWYLQAEVNMTRGIRIVGDTEYTQWADAELATDIPQVVSATLISMQKFESYETVTGHSVDLPSISFDSAGSGWTTATECNSRMYYGNIKIKDAHGRLKEFNDAMVRSDVGKYDKVAHDNMVTVIENDGESIVALKTVGNQILQFKEKTLYIIDTSSGYEVLLRTEKFMGVNSPRAIADVVGGLAWVNKYGLWYYNGGNKGVMNLLEIKGIPKIPLSEWSEWFDAGYTSGYDGTPANDGWVSYDPETQWIYIFKTSTELSANGLGYAYNIGTGTLCNVSYDGVLNRASTIESGAITGAPQKTNSILYKNKALFAINNSIGANVNDGVRFAKFGARSMNNTSSFKLVTADMNFGNPVSRKKIVRYNISHKSSATDSGILPLHRENGGGSWNEFGTNASFDGSNLLFNDNLVANNSFETEGGGGSTTADSWTLSALGAGGSSTYRFTYSNAIRGTQSVAVVMGSGAEASGAQAYLEQTGISLVNNQTYLLSFWLRFNTSHGYGYISAPSAGVGNIKIYSATGGDGTAVTHWNGTYWQSAEATIPLNELNNIEQLRSFNNNIIQHQWVQLSTNIIARAGDGSSDNWRGVDISDLKIRLSLPDINSSTLRVDAFSLTNIYGGYTIADLVPINSVGDIYGNIYSSQFGLYGSNTTMIDTNAKINDISVIYRERTVK